MGSCMPVFPSLLVGILPFIWRDSKSDFCGLASLTGYEASMICATAKHNAALTLSLWVQEGPKNTTRVAYEGTSGP